MKYIQSFYQYAVTFSSIGKSVPAKDADGDLRNIAAFEDKEVETLEKSEPMFRQLVEQKKYRVLNKLPESYKPAAILVNEARQAEAEAKAEAEAAKAELEALKAEKTAEEKTESKTAAKKSSKK